MSSPSFEAELAARSAKINGERLGSPWVPVEKKYEFETDVKARSTFAELFDGRSQLLAYNIMFGPDYRFGACPAARAWATGLDGSLVHLNHLRLTLLCFSRGRRSSG